MAVTAAGTPYVESSDNVADYPGVSLALANHIDATAGKVLQVVTATHATEVSTTSTSWVTTGITATITPSSASSKILILANSGVESSLASSQSTSFTIFRGTVAGTNLGDSARGMAQCYALSTTNLRVPLSINYLDSPSTTSAQAYTLGMQLSGSGSTGYSSRQSSVSSITLIEVAA